MHTSEKNKISMSACWDHMQFLQELIYDFVGWGSSDTGDDTTTAGDRVCATTCRDSSYSSVLTIFLTWQQKKDERIYFI